MPRPPPCPLPATLLLAHQALEALRKLRTEKAAAIKEMKAQIETLRAVGALRGGGGRGGASCCYGKGGGLPLRCSAGRICPCPRGRGLLRWTASPGQAHLPGPPRHTTPTSLPAAFLAGCLDSKARPACLLGCTFIARPLSHIRPLPLACGPVPPLRPGPTLPGRDTTPTPSPSPNQVKNQATYHQRDRDVAEAQIGSIKKQIGELELNIKAGGRARGRGRSGARAREGTGRLGGRLGWEGRRLTRWRGGGAGHGGGDGAHGPKPAANRNACIVATVG